MSPSREGAEAATGQLAGAGGAASRLTANWHNTAQRGAIVTGRDPSGADARPLARAFGP
jgi:hypothetical protein